MLWDDYVWILVVSVLLAFFTSFGIGANDVANAFATSVGAKSVTLPQAILIAAIFEFSGALLLGAGVTKTISHGLVEIDKFEDQPELLMYGMMCVIAATGLWLLLACYLELPVSTTHSTIGGVIGFTLVAHGWEAIQWYGFDDSKSALNKFEGVVPIVASWLTSPILAGCIAAGLFWFVRTFILRADNSFARSLQFFPLLVGISCVVNLYYICLVGFDKKKLDHDGKKETVSDILGFGWSSVIAWTVSAIVVVVLWFTFIPWLRKQAVVEDTEDNRAEINIGESSTLLQKSEGKDIGQRTKSWVDLAADALNTDVHDSIQSDAAVSAVHEQSEKFDPSAERAFSYLQVFTAACVSFAHGANDVANSVGPLAAVYSIYRHSHVTSDSHVPVWVLLIGAMGIVLGLAVYGHTIIRAIGVKLVKVSPARGFTMEFATAAVITFGSIYGIPLSTTHCQVGSTTAVGLMEGKRGVNIKLLMKVFAGWIVTIVIVAITAGLFFAQGVYAPSQFNLDSIQTYEKGINHACQSMAESVLGSDVQAQVEAQALEFENIKQDISGEHVSFLNDVVSQVVDACQSG